MSEKILGIDLGTTNSLVGVVDSGFPILFADKNGTTGCFCLKDPKIEIVDLRIILILSFVFLDY